MVRRIAAFIGLSFFMQTKVSGQDYFSFGGGNFSGLNQVISNPAAAADNRLKWDIVLAGLDFNFNNSWFGIKRTALKNTGSITDPTLPSSWRNLTPNVPQNVFKNFTVLDKVKKRAGILEGRILLPSLMYQLDQKNALAFTWNIRHITNFDGLSQQFTYLFEKELDLNVTQNNRVQSKRMSMVQMTWAEYGVTYARVLKDKQRHFIKAGITPKLLQGLESMYVVINDLDFYLSSKDTSSYFDMGFSFAHSSNFNSGIPAYRFVSKPGLGFDLGIIYEWRPGYQRFKYKPDNKHYSWRKDLNKYKMKLGASIVDIGKIKFEKHGAYYDLDVAVRRDDVTKFVALKNVEEFDSLLKADFSHQNQSTHYNILLPTALNIQLDYSLNQFFYLNLSAHVADLFKSNPYRVHNYSALCFAPRMEHYWFDVSVPFTYNVLSSWKSRYVMTGFNIRLGALSFGSSDVVPLFKGDVSAFNFYALLKVSIPYKQIRDQDKDGVKDKNDLCPDDAGEITLNGCPDADHDKIPDKEDACPHQPGLSAFRGCPDTDADGITDGEDACPNEKGIMALKGCPDSDSDGTINKNDACPDVAGPKELKGCPDSDTDGIVDREDLCPALKGPLQFKGCPDTDKDKVHDGIDQCKELAGDPENNGCPWPDTDGDGIIDKQDSCVTVSGAVALKGCPEPVKLAPVEKRILEKAISSLEFESGKDIIKPASLPSLTALSKLLVSHATNWQIRLSGHTDNEGTSENNFLLSEKRARAVKNYLVRKGVTEEAIIVEWFGQSRPVADNTSKEGKKKNRRVEMIMLMKGQ